MTVMPKMFHRTKLVVLKTKNLHYTLWQTRHKFCVEYLAIVNWKNGSMAKMNAHTYSNMIKSISICDTKLITDFNL